MIQGVCSYGRMPFLIGGTNMNDMEFIEALKTKRNACGYSQSRLAKELHISKQNLNDIENGKTRASKEMKHTLLHYLDYCNCTQPFTLNVDYLRVCFSTTDALEIIKDVLAMKIEYFIHEDYGLSALGTRLTGKRDKLVQFSEPLHGL